MRLSVQKRMPPLAALVVGLAFGGSYAQADLVLDIQHTGSLVNQHINIVNGSAVGSGNGSFTFTGTAGFTFNFTIDGQAESVKPGVSGTVTGTFNTTDANFISFSDTAFGEFQIGSLTATRSQTSQDSFVDDVNTDVSRNANTTNRTLVVTTGTSFSQPSTPTVLLQSMVTLSTTDPNAGVALNSTLGSTTVGATANQANPSSTAFSSATPGSNPYNVTSQFTISQLGDSANTSQTATIDARTDVFASDGSVSDAAAAPEPSTLAGAATGVLMFAGYVWRTRRKVRVGVA